MLNQIHVHKLAYEIRKLEYAYVFVNGNSGEQCHLYVIVV